MEKNQQNLRAQYFETSQEYAREYQKYLDLKYSKNSGDEAKAVDVYARLQEIDKKLKKLMEQVEMKPNDVGSQLLETNVAIERKTFQIYEKSKTLDKQKNEIQHKQQELRNRQKQIEMGVQKNKYRRNVIIFLTIINLVMLALIYKFYNSTA
jgi:hypothetical protein